MCKSFETLWNYALGDEARRRMKLDDKLTRVAAIVAEALQDG